MLYEIDDPALPFSRLAADVVRGFTIRRFCERRETFPARLLVDNPAEPRVLIGLAGAMLNVTGEMHLLNGALADIFAGRVAAHGGWPTPELAADWERSKRRYLFFNASSYASWRAARIAGFEPDPDDTDGFVAYQWHFLGAPRFAHLVQHSCRVLESAELLDYVRRGVPYDPDGHYIRLCLENGPSFVCEIPDAEYAALTAETAAQASAGAKPAVLDAWFKETPDKEQERPALPPLRPGWIPVCWSCTHVNGFMGMIYTPAALRRQGYARSLAAVQIDTMLAREGIACCHVIDFNTPSMLLVQSMGGVCTPEAIVWRQVYWPGDQPQQHEKLELA
jgi:hypothetical protein